MRLKTYNLFLESKMFSNITDDIIKQICYAYNYIESNKIQTAGSNYKNGHVNLRDKFISVSLVNTHRMEITESILSTYINNMKKLIETDSSPEFHKSDLKLHLMIELKEFEALLLEYYNKIKNLKEHKQESIDAINYIVEVYDEDYNINIGPIRKLINLDDASHPVYIMSISNGNDPNSPTYNKEWTNNFPQFKKETDRIKQKLLGYFYKVHASGSQNTQTFHCLD